jgi:hypothetical protein
MRAGFEATSLEARSASLQGTILSTIRRGTEILHIFHGAGGRGMRLRRRENADRDCRNNHFSLASARGLSGLTAPDLPNTIAPRCSRGQLASAEVGSVE